MVAVVLRASAYDDAQNNNGNMNTDHRKAMNITYNHLNLPEQFNIGGDLINITYDAAGVKLKKETIGTDGTTTIRHYVGGIEYTGYANIQVEAIYHSEGRAVPTDGSVTLRVMNYSCV